MYKKTPFGFTLIEILLTISIMAVISFAGFTSYTSFITQQQLTNESNAFLIFMNVVKSEAIKQKRLIHLRAHNISDPNNEWGGGWCITAGPNACTHPMNQCCDLNTLIKLHPIDNDKITLNSLSNMSVYTYNSKGILDNTTLSNSIDFCIDSISNGRTISISSIGKISIQKKDNC